MTPGPPPKPTAKKKLEGNPGKRPLNPHEPQLPVADASMDAVPPLLADDELAAAEWRRLAPLLRQARVLTEADRGALLAACQQWSLYQDALANAPKQRRVLRSPNDYPIPNPYIPMAMKALLHCERLWEQLGLTPAARVRLAAAPLGPEADDAFAEFDAPRLRRLAEGPSFLGRREASDDEPTTH